MIEFAQALLFFSWINGLVILAQAFLSGFRALPEKLLFQIQDRLNRVTLLNLFLGLCALLVAFLSKDMSVAAVFHNASHNTPLRYRFAGIWGTLQTSHFFWTFLASLFSQVLITKLRKKNLSMSLLRLGLQIQVFILTCLVLLSYWITNPFQRFLPLGDYGEGLNALLQNPYMVIHPPILFMGYSSLLNSFLLSLLWQKSETLQDDLILRRQLRFWSRLAWFFLTLGIALGCRWAYLELGWGGYWAWDPVENSSLMPWLALTLGVHLDQKEEKKAHLAARYLFAFSFILTFFGTFLTRSSLVSSIHSFAVGAVGPAYLLLLFFFLFLTFWILGGEKSSDFLDQGGEKNLSQTLFFDYNLLALFTLFAVTFLGTCAPILYELLFGKKLTIQENFYNAFLPLIGGLIVLSLAGWSWQHQRFSKSFKWFLFFFAFFSSVFVFFQPYFSWSVRVLQFLLLLAGLLFTRLMFFWEERPWKKGAFWLLHMGLLLFFFAVSLGTLNRFQDVSFQKKDVISLWNYEIRHEGLAFADAPDEVRVHANLSIKDGKRFYQLEPGRSRYSHDHQWFNEVDYKSFGWYDLYFSLQDFDLESERADLRFYVNGGVPFLWAGFFAMLLGSVGLTFHRLMRRSEHGIL